MAIYNYPLGYKLDPAWLRRDCTGGLYRISGRGNGKTFIPMYSTASLEIQKGLRKALMNESYGVKPGSFYNSSIETVKMGEPIDIHGIPTMNWYITSAATKEDLIRYIKNDVNSVYGIARQIEDDIMKGEPKVENYIKDVIIKKKVSKKGLCMQYNFMLDPRFAFLKIENYDEDCNLSADFILSLAHVCCRCSVSKLIFRDHKVIAISAEYRYCGEDEKTKKPIWKQKSYVANCMDADDYNPYIGATIAINKCVADTQLVKDSKSHLRRLREKIDRASEDA